MITIGITSYKEPKTIGRAIEAIESQGIKDYEIIICAPDKETLSAADKYRKNNNKIRLLMDKGNGKPAALNLLVEKARGDILFLTDGDVYVGKKAIQYMLDILKDEKVGAVTGRPISINNKNNKFGFWAYMLSNIAHQRRLYAQNKGKRFFCSGYLFAIKKKIMPSLPENLLSEDGYISHKVYQNGFKIRYSPKSEVYVKYPDNFSDWIKQKKRSAGGYNQIKDILGIEMRSFRTESSGLFGFFKFASNFKELYWLIQLFIARIYLWIVIYRDIDMKKKSQKEVWERVESTK